MQACIVDNCVLSMIHNKRQANNMECEFDLGTTFIMKRSDDYMIENWNDIAQDYTNYYGCVPNRLALRMSDEQIAHSIQYLPRMNLSKAIQANNVVWLRYHLNHQHGITPDDVAITILHNSIDCLKLLPSRLYLARHLEMAVQLDNIEAARHLIDSSVFISPTALRYSSHNATIADLLLDRCKFNG